MGGIDKIIVEWRVEIDDCVGVMNANLIQKLAKFIDSHDNCMFCCESFGKLVVASLVRNPDGSHDMKRETIEPTLQAARDWLGY